MTPTLAMPPLEAGGLPPPHAKKSKKVEDVFSLSAALERIAAIGWRPGSILDIGVGVGTEGLYGVWPDAHMILVDPVQENRPYMEQIKSLYPRVDIHQVAAGRRNGETVGRVLRGTGLSIMGSTMESPDWENGRFPMMTVDAIVAASRAEPPHLIKIDTDNKELDIVAGARRTLRQTDVVIVETKIYNVLRKMATPAQLFATLDRAGFAFTDIVEIYQNAAGFTRVVDFLFARTASDLFSALEVHARKPSKAERRREQRKAALKENPFIG